MEKSTHNSIESKSNNILKFLIPSLLGLFLFVIPIPYGNLIHLDGLSTYSLFLRICKY